MPQRRKHFLIAGIRSEQISTKQLYISVYRIYLSIRLYARTYNNGQREDCNRMDFDTLVKNHHTTMIILNPNDKYERYRQYSSSSGLYLVKL